MKEKQCTCGGTEFTASQRCYHDIIVNSCNIFVRDTGISDANRPHGPYICIQCNIEYDELDGLDEVEIADVKADSAENTEATSMFEQFKITKAPRNAIHISWSVLDSLFSSLLTALLGRDIRVDVGREEYYYWMANLLDSITFEELEILHSILQASESDKDTNDFGEYPVVELSEGLCNKLIDKLLPFGLDSSRADDDGVWFIGDVRQPQ
jgi:hypothetical protein